jgi:hypothetical protein
VAAALAAILARAAARRRPGTCGRAGVWSVDQAAAFLLLPLVDMILLAGFFARRSRIAAGPRFTNG